MVVSHQELSNAVRFLSIDAVERAKSGHPGMPLGMADIATVLFKEVMVFDPSHPKWINRDRLVVSNGHGSMLLYACLHLSGYGISIEDIKNFRQLGSPCCGHPELETQLGIETTTGPLGQGLANAIGLAIARNMANDEFSIQNRSIIDYHTYVLAGDGLKSPERQMLKQGPSSFSSSTNREEGLHEDEHDDADEDENEDENEIGDDNAYEI